MLDNLKEFNSDLDDIEKLISTPNLVRSLALSSLESLDLSLLKYTDRQHVDNIKSAIKNISDKSLKQSYNVIYNQTCVSAVSALEASLERYFVNYINSNWKNLNFSNDFGKIKISFQELKDLDFKITPNLGLLILNKDSSVNFQDLKSIIRSFDKYLNKNLNIESSLADNIIFYQQTRHVILHKNGIIDREFLEKSLIARQRFEEGEKIQLNESDWSLIKDSFSFFASLIFKKED